MCPIFVPTFLTGNYSTVNYQSFSVRYGRQRFIPTAIQHHLFFIFLYILINSERWSFSYSLSAPLVSMFIYHVGMCKLIFRLYFVCNWSSTITVDVFCRFSKFPIRLVVRSFKYRLVLVQLYHFHYIFSPSVLSTRISLLVSVVSFSVVVPRCSLYDAFFRNLSSWLL